MKLATKLLLGYLAVTSVILHLLILALALLSFPAMRETWNTANEFERAHQGQAANKAVVQAVSELKDGEYTYTGYALEYKGQSLYAAGVGESFKVGDQVAVIVQRHPYPPLKTMSVLVVKDGR